MFGKAGKNVSIDEMNRTIAARGGVGSMIGIDSNVLVQVAIRRVVDLSGTDLELKRPAWIV